MNCNREEIREAGIDRVIPHRKSKKGSKPGVTSREIFNGLKTRKNNMKRVYVYDEK